MITIRIWILYTPYYHCTIIIYYYVLIYTIRIWLLLGTIRIWILYTPYYHCTIIIYYYVLIYTIRIWLLLGTIRIWILYTPYYYCPIIIFYYLLRYTIRIWLFYKLIYTRSKINLYYFLLFDGSLDDQDPWTSTSPTTPWSSRWFWRCSPRWRRPPASAPPR